MTNTNPYVCSENNLNTPECVSVPYENSEESIEMYGDYDNMQGFDHTLQTDAVSDYHKYLKEHLFKPVDGKNNHKHFTKWRKKITPANHTKYLKMHDDHKKKNPPKAHNANGSHLEKAKAAYITMNAEYRKFYDRYDWDAWAESRKILKTPDTEKMQQLKEDFKENYKPSPRQKEYINMEGENNDFIRKNYEDMINCKVIWFTKMEKEAKTKHLEDIQKGIEQQGLKKASDQAKHVKKAEAASPF